MILTPPGLSIFELGFDFSKILEFLKSSALCTVHPIAEWDSSHGVRLRGVHHTAESSSLVSQTAHRRVRIENFAALWLLSNVSESLRSLTKNEWLWAILSGAQRKWVIVSESLGSLTKNEHIAHFFEQIAHLLTFFKKRAILLEKRWANYQPW